MEDLDRTASILKGLTWEGEYWGKDGAIRIARDIYNEMPDKYFPDYVGTLYSALSRLNQEPRDAQVVFRQISVARKLIPFAPTLQEQVLRGLTPEGYETHASWLYGISRIPRAPFLLPNWSWRLSYTRAVDAAHLGLLAEDKAKHLHTRPLLRIIRARLFLDSRMGSVYYDPLQARLLIKSAETFDFNPSGITDAKQLARVRKGISEVYALLGKPDLAEAWRLKADQTPGIAPDTKHKLRLV